MRRIQIKGSNGRYEEIVAASEIKPGHIGEVIAAGTVQKHSTEGGFLERIIVLENGLEGSTTVATAYAAADQVFCYYALPGDVVAIYLKVGESITKGGRVVSSGEGSVVAEATATTVKGIVGIADETLDLSASGAVDTLIRVRIV